MDPRWRRPHPSELSPLHQLWILPKMRVCPCFLLAPVFVGLEKNLCWSGRTCRTPTGLVRFVYAGDRWARCRIMPRSVKPVIPYSTAKPHDAKKAARALHRTAFLCGCRVPVPPHYITDQNANGCIPGVKRLANVTSKS